MGRPFKVGSLSKLSVTLRFFIRWMVQAKYRRFCELDAEACEGFLDSLVESKVKADSEEDGLTAQSLNGYLSLWIKLYHQGALLKGAGIDPLPQIPFGGRSGAAVGRDLTRKICSRIPPVPDRVFLPVTQSAISWLDVPSKDILRLQEMVMYGHEESRPVSACGPKARRPTSKNLLQAILSFRFSGMPGDPHPWHPSIQNREIALGRRGAINMVSLRPLQKVRHLILSLRDACTIVLQAFIGMRISEVCGLNAYPLDPKTGLPACVEIKPSRSGLYDVFYVKGRVFKMSADSQEVTWVAGLRPHGTSYLPPPIQALVILERLFKPWRDLIGSSALIVSFTGQIALPRNVASIGPIRVEQLAEGERDWIKRYVTLPADLAEWRVTSHQWRKSFALYSIRTDSRMLPAISQHFKHLSVAMTEQAYVGNDAELLGILEETAMRETTRILYEVTTGQIAAGGKMAEMIRERAKDIEARFIGKSESERQAEIDQVVSSSDLRVWSCDWGWCFFRPETARCHVQPLISITRVHKPNDALRNPSTCCACANLMTTQEHVPFWVARRSKWQQALEESRGGADEAYCMVANDKIRQCDAILRLMGVDSTSNGIRHAS